ncbi:MAG: hypothetical protein GQ560_04885 [Dehalococcoidia bacterium]|nr:hypothetical protein [Dehalococcoidia bacterium]
MKFFTRVSLTTYISISPLLILPQMADANVDQAYGITIVQVITGILVFGLFLGNHYRGRIRTAFKKFFPRSDGRAGSGD